MERIYFGDNEFDFVDFEEKTRYVNFVGGTRKRISKEEWGKYLITSGGDDIEAVLIWLEDNEYIHNAEQEALVRETAGQRVDIDKDAGKKKKKGSGRKKENDPDKIKLMETLTTVFPTWNIVDSNSKISDGVFTFTLTKDKKTSKWETKEIKKPNAEKVQIVSNAAAALEKVANTVVIGNPQKLIYIEYNENTYKLNLVKAKGEKKNG